MKIYQVDAFTPKPFAGNPAAVCVLASAAQEDWMQKVALEMNLSETAFLFPEGDGYRLRWFTPTLEVSLCGHATLASSHVLWSEGFLPPAQPARFHTLSGLLTARREGGWIEMDFPAQPAVPCEKPEWLERSLGVPVLTIARSNSAYLAEIAPGPALRALKPDLAAMERGLRREKLIGVMVTCLSQDPDYDFLSRFFGPAAGVPEDPVTGSAHCALGPFWSQRLGKNPLVGFQASSRGGVVKVRCEGNRVFLGGQAVTVLRGDLVEGAVPFKTGKTAV
jgi:predicted PhzF superfamily epimerase YddE/YHI9